ncbi:MAG: hypothetical protein AMXMBFR64_01950 [Myxococcales bacterium]
MAEENDRKERVLHTRVPEHLDEEIRRRANRLGVSVSNLVRNALAHTFGLVEDVIADSASVARSARGEGPPPRVAPKPAAILGWQALVLNLNAICAHCNVILPRGTEAALVVTDPPGSREFICTHCLKELRHDGSTGPSDASDA